MFEILADAPTPIYAMATPKETKRYLRSVHARIVSVIAPRGAVCSSPYSTFTIYSLQVLAMQEPSFADIDRLDGEFNPKI